MWLNKAPPYNKKDMHYEQHTECKCNLRMTKNTKPFMLFYSH